MINESPKFAIVLSGCGVFDGSEIHEAVCTMLAVEQFGCSYQCFAPNTWQARTIDHFTGTAVAIAGDDDNRNVLAESSRLSRRNTKDLKDFKASDFDAIIFPGGFGAVLNLSDFAIKAADCEVNEEVKRAINESYDAGIVIGAMCIAPVVIAKVLGKNKIKLTVGNDEKVMSGLNKMGATAVSVPATEVCVDAENKIVTTPCYMLCTSLKDVAEGTKNLIDEMLELIDY